MERESGWYEVRAEGVNEVMRYINNKWQIPFERRDWYASHPPEVIRKVEIARDKNHSCPACGVIQTQLELIENSNDNNFWYCIDCQYGQDKSNYPRHY